MSEKDKKKISYKSLQVYLLVAVGVILLFNMYQISVLKSSVTGTRSAAVSNNLAAGGISLEEAAAKVIPRGIPEVYGKQLGVTFEDPVGSLNKLAKLDPWTDISKLNSEELTRYVNIGSRIACEFCCGAKTLVQKNGMPACGCAHSAAMRGLNAWLIQNSDMTDDQILDELTRWKSLFFPKQMITRYIQSNGGSSASVSELPDMVGGC